MRFIPPITPAEFLNHLQRCIPPFGWSPRIAVANSGGPDSTALLYLLATTIRERSGNLTVNQADNYGLPQELVSIHVNHKLQNAATAMQDTATITANRLGVHSQVQTIPWGSAPFPAQPGESTAGEKIAREARYNRLFYGMQQARASVIAFAHHADDQVETAIMRMSQGSSFRGLAGMRPVRRWGMGQKDNDYYSFGIDGMRTWIVRPFLEVPKDRLLATCEAYGLDYVVDPTNFQPGITLRNSIRHIISKSAKGVPVSLEGVDLDITPYVDKLRTMIPHAPPRDQLREAVRLFGIRLEETETQVTKILERAQRKSPPSTLLLTSARLAEVTTDELRTALIRRALRYVSYGPWGSLWAEANGDRNTFRRIASKLWPDIQLEPRRAFTAGAGVEVIPVALKEETTIRFREPELDEETEAWIFCRTRPYQLSPTAADLALRRDVTDGLIDARKKGGNVYSVLYDYRFAVRFNLLGCPPIMWSDITERGARITIEPEAKYILPRVVISGPNTAKRDISRVKWHGIQDPHYKAKRAIDHQKWIRMEFVRSLDVV